MNDKIQKLDELKTLCDETEKKYNGIQNDDSLVEFIKNEYPKMSVNGLKTILKAVKGKKEKTKPSTEERSEMINYLMGMSHFSGINPNAPKSNKFVGFDGLRKRIAQKKNGLKSEFTGM